MAGLPEGFVIQDAPQKPSGLPEGFEIENPDSVPVDVAKSIGSQGLAGFADLPAAAMGAMNSVAPWVQKKLVAAGLLSPQQAQQQQERFNQHFGPGPNPIEQLPEQASSLHEPQSFPGQLAGGAARMVTGSAIGGPEGVLSRIGAGALGGAASELAGKATEGTSLELPARVLAAVAAPGAASKVTNRLVNGAPAKITADALKANADQGYDAFRNSGLQLDPEAAQVFANKMKYELSQKGLTERNAKEVHGLLDEMAQMPASGANWDANGIQAARSELGGYMASTQDHKPTQLAKAASLVGNALDEHLNTLDPRYVRAGDLPGTLDTLNKANEDWAAYRRASSLNRGEYASILGAGAANSGMNLGNAERQQIKSALLAKDAGKWSPAERAAMERIVKGSLLSNTLRRASNLAGGGGGLGAAGLAIGAGALGEANGMGPEGFALPIAGHLLRSAANRAVMKQLERLQQQTAMRSTLGRQQVPMRTPPLVSPGAALRAIIAAQQSRTPNASLSP